MGHPVSNIPGAMPTAELEAMMQPVIESHQEKGAHSLEKLLYFDGRTSHMIVWEGDYQISLPDGHPRKLDNTGGGFDVGDLNNRVQDEVTALFEQGHSHEIGYMSWEAFCDYINAEENHETRQAISDLRGVNLVFMAATENPTHRLSRGWIMSILEYAIQRAATARTR